MSGVERIARAIAPDDWKLADAPQYAHLPQGARDALTRQSLAAAARVVEAMKQDETKSTLDFGLGRPTCTCQSSFDGEGDGACPAHVPDRLGVAVAAVDRVREIHARESPGIGSDCCAADGHKWPCPTVAALDGAPEPEWEYGGALDDVTRANAHPSREIAERHVDGWNETAMRAGRHGRSIGAARLVRRRPAGAWELVEVGNNDDD